MQAGLRRLITGLRKTGSTIRGAIGRLKAYVTQLRKVSRAQRKVASTAGFLKKVLVGIGVIVLLRKVVRGFQSATRIVADFQQAMSTVRAVTESTGEKSLRPWKLGPRNWVLPPDLLPHKPPRAW
jgi:hypothetical protein